MRIIFLCIVLSLTGGCVKYQPRSLSASRTILNIEARTLDNSGLKQFMEANLGREISPYPPNVWDFSMLTLAAFYYHPDLDVARAQWGIAEAEIITAAQSPNPNIGFTPQINTSTVGGASPWILNFKLDIPIETAGKRGYRITRARYLSNAARLNIGGTAWQVRSRVRKSLLNLYASNQLQILLEREESLQEEIVRLLEKRLSSGEIARIEADSAYIPLEQTRLSLSEVKRQGAEADVQLAYALGLQVSAIEGITFSFDFLKRLSPEIPSEDIRRQSLLNRADILSALSEYDASQSALQLEIAKQYPDIQLGPGYSWDQGGNKWSIGFSITLPVFHQNQGPIAEAEARRRKAEADFTALQLRVIGEIDRTLTGYRNALLKLEAADSLVSLEKRHLQSMEAMFKIGEIDRLALLIAYTELISSEISHLNALVNGQQSLVVLEDAVQVSLNELPLSAVIPENKEGGNK